MQVKICATGNKEKQLRKTTNVLQYLHKEETAVRRVHFVGKINREIFSVIAPDITTDEVIITDERIEHINMRHQESYSLIEPHLNQILNNPDFILSDDKNRNTALILKRIAEGDMRFHVVLRLQTNLERPEMKNSIISAWKIREQEWNRLIRNKKVVYKHE